MHFSHALRNTLIPIITVSGIQLGYLVAFAVVVEQVFQWPGMGLLFLQALGQTDVPRDLRLPDGGRASSSSPSISSSTCSMPSPIRALRIKSWRPVSGPGHDGIRLATPLRRAAPCGDPAPSDGSWRSPVAALASARSPADRIAARSSLPGSRRQTPTTSPPSTSSTPLAPSLHGWR